jgi:hypothetical protein
MRSPEPWQDFIARNSAQFERHRQRQKPIRMKDIGGKGRHRFAREAWTFMPQHHLPEKVFVIERLRKIKFEGRLARHAVFREGDIEYRIGYFIVGRNGQMRGRWIWGQFCPLIPRRDFGRLLRTAKQEGTII